MKLFLMMSWRNLWRHKRRSMIVIASIAIGIFAMMFSMGIMNGFNTQMVENTISTSLGHIAIHDRGFHDNIKLQYNFNFNDGIRKAIEENDAIVAYAPRVKVQGMIRSSETSKGVMIVGVNPEREKKVSSIYSYTSTEEGSMFLKDTKANEILISKTMAEDLDVLVGDRIVVMIQDRENEIVGVGLQVTGVFESPIASFDKYFVFVGIDKLQEMTGLEKNISEITVITDDKDRVDSVARILRARINDNGLEILTWKQLAPNLVSAVKLFDSMMVVFFMIIFITVIFSVANTLIMAIMERFHEIGVMKCVGTSPVRIFFMIIFEALNLGAVGLGFGIAVSLVLIMIFSVTGLDFSFYMESMRTWGSGSIIYPSIRVIDILNAGMIVLITTLVASLYPAVKAARIKPLEALHHI